MSSSLSSQPRKILSIRDQVAMSICIICGIYGAVFGGITLTENVMDLAVLNFCMSMLLFSLAVWIYKKPGLTAPKFILISVSSSYFVYLFYSGGYNNYGFLWGILVPATSFLFLGTALGICMSGIYLFAIVFLYLFGNMISPGYRGIPPDLFIRYAGIYFIIGMTTFIYEKSRIDNEIRLADEMKKRLDADEKIAMALRESERMNRLMSGREDRILELKSEVNRLLRDAGKPHQYSSAEDSVGDAGDING